MQRSFGLVLAVAALSVVSASLIHTPSPMHDDKLLEFPTAKDVPKVPIHQFTDAHPQWAANVPKAISTTCQTSLTAMVTAFTKPLCVVKFGLIGTFFTASQRGVAQDTQQENLASFCSSDCRTEALASVRALRDSCSATEIAEFELYTAGVSNATDPFSIRKIVYTLNLPCVQNNEQTEYCLPAFSGLVKLVTNHPGPNAQYAAADLDPASGGVCRPCAFKFFVALTAFAQAGSVRAWRPIFLVCLFDRPNSRYCVPEVQYINSMPQATGADVIAKYQRLCSTRCYQKFVIAAQAFQLGDFGNATARNAANRVLEAIDGVCLANAAAQWCYPKWVGIGEDINAATTAGCVLPSPDGNGPAPSCSPACKTVIQERFINQWGCCFPAWLFIRARYGEAPRAVTSLQIARYVNTTCDLPFGGACARAARFAAFVLRLENVAWAWVATHQAQFWAAVRADVAAYLGAPYDDVSGSGPDSGVAANTESLGPMAHTLARDSNTKLTVSIAPLFRKSGGGFLTQAGTSASLQIAGDTNSGVDNVQATADYGLADASFDLTNTNQLPTEAFSDPSKGASLQATGDSSDGTRHTPAFTVFAGAFALAAYALL